MFVDESGCIAFGPGDDKYFIFAMILPKSGKELSRCIKNFNAYLIRNGWNPDVEVKASNIWHSPNNPKIPDTYKFKASREQVMKDALSNIAALDIKIEYLVVKLDTLKESLKRLPNTILYNFFGVQLLKQPLMFYDDVQLYIDKRSKEYHDLLKFDGYIETQIATCRAVKDKPKLALTIRHYSSKCSQGLTGSERANVDFAIRGIEAADFACWAVRSKFEKSDDRWIKLIEKKIGWKQTLYFKV